MILNLKPAFDANEYETTEQMSNNTDNVENIFLTTASPVTAETFIYKCTHSTSVIVAVAFVIILMPINYT